MTLSTILLDAATTASTDYAAIAIKAGQFLLAITILVGLHEMGHLLAAKAFGMRVEQFSIGFPPKIFGRKFGETEYTIGAIPLGGFVKISGMVDESLDKNQLAGPPQPWEFRSKPAWQRLIVMLGGIIVNVLTAIVVFTVLTFQYGESYLPAREARYGIVASNLAQQIGLQTGDKILEINGKSFKDFSDISGPDLLLSSGNSYTVERNGDLINIPVPDNLADRLSSQSREQPFVMPIEPFRVGDLVPGEAAERVGVKVGDQITSVNGTPIHFFHELQATLREHPSETVNLGIMRDGKALELKATLNDRGQLGFAPQSLLKMSTSYFGLIESVGRGTVKSFDIVYRNIQGFAKIGRGEASFSNSVSGPIGIARIFPQHFSWAAFWALAGMLSMVLAFMNLLPIPALDGGHVMFLTWEMISRRKPSEKFLEGAQKVGMALLLSLMVFAVFNDGYKLFINHDEPAAPKPKTEQSQKPKSTDI